MTDTPKPGNLEAAMDVRGIFESAMRQLGWTDVALKNLTPEGYSDGRLQWAWISWQVALKSSLIQTAIWYKEKGWLLDEDDVPQAILDLGKDR